MTPQRTGGGRARGKAARPANILSLAQHGLPRTPRTVALARLLHQIAQNMATKAA